MWSCVWKSREGWKGDQRRSGLLQHNRLIDCMLQQGITPYTNLYQYPKIEKHYRQWFSPHFQVEFKQVCEAVFSIKGGRLRTMPIPGSRCSEIEWRTGLPSTNALLFWVWQWYPCTREVFQVPWRRQLKDIAKHSCAPSHPVAVHRYHLR